MTLLTRSLLVSLAAAAFAPTLDAQAYAAFVFDRSGSMLTIRPSSLTSRADFSQATGMGDVAWFFFLHNVINLQSATCLVFEYQGSTVTQIGGVHTTAASAQAAVASLSGANYATPLAEALCTATNAVVALDTFALPTQRSLYVYSDGGENSSSICNGPQATSGDHCLQQWPGSGGNGAFNIGSWQEIACNIIHAQITTNVYYFSDFVDIVTPETFFQAICDMSGGNLTSIDDDSTVSPENPWRDIGVGCTDFHGTRLSLSHNGLPQLGNTVEIGCRTSNPLPFILGVGFSSTSIGGSPLPFNLGPLGAPGCRLYSSWDVMDGFFPWNGKRFMPIPASTGLVGLSLYYQGAQLHALNNALGLATSNTLKMTIAP